MPGEGTESDWPTEVRTLAPGVHAYVQAGGTWFVGNAGLITSEDGSIAVDSLHTMAMNECLMREWRQLTSAPFRHLLVTHPHSDHFFGAHLFSGATIICHRRCQDLMLAMADELEETKALFERLFPEFDLTGVQVTPAHLTFESSLDLHQEHRVVRVAHLGVAHTVGDIVAHLPDEGVVFAGDLLFNRVSPLCIQGSIRGWIAALQALESYDADTFVPGHGPICDRQGLAECKGYWELLYEQGMEKRASGLAAREAALSFDLGAYRRWANPERVVPNMLRLYRELDGDDPMSDIHVADVLTDMFDLVRAGFPS